MARFTKTPFELITIAVEYKERLPSGETVASGTVSSTDQSGVVTSTTVLGSTTATISGTQAKVIVRAGTAGERHKVTFQTTLSGGTQFEDSILMDIAE